MIIEIDIELAPIVECGETTTLMVFDHIGQIKLFEASCHLPKKHDGYEHLGMAFLTEAGVHAIWDDGECPVWYLEGVRWK